MKPLLDNTDIYHKMIAGIRVIHFTVLLFEFKFKPLIFWEVAII